jgi:thiol-disulfide isomerase/thioredoxin
MRFAGRVLILMLASYSMARSEEPSIKSLLEKVSTRYRNLGPCRITAKITESSATSGGNAASYEAKLTYEAGAGGKYRAEQTGGDTTELMVTDGDTTWRVLPSKKFWSEDKLAVDAEDEDQEDDAPGTDFISQMRTMLVTRYTKLGHFVENAHIDKTTSVTFQGKKTPCYTVRIHTADLKIEMTISADDYLVLRHKVSGMTHISGGRSASVQTTVELTSLSTRIEEADFTYTAPAQYKQLKGFLLPDERNVSMVGQKAADFALPRADGSPVRLSALRGKVVLVDFWATWCPPCRAELPTIAKLAAKYADKDLVVLPVNSEKGDIGQRYLSGHHFQLTNVMDTNRQVQRLYRCSAIPTVLVIDRSGTVVAHFVGGRDESELQSALKQAGL